jgi:hypothetical protein
MRGGECTGVPGVDNILPVVETLTPIFLIKERQ